MSLTHYPHKVVLLTTPFKYPHRKLLFPRARLYADRVELSGWTPSELHKAEIRIGQLAHIEWLLDAFNAPNVVFHIQDGGQIPLFLKQIHRWQHTLEELLCWQSTPANLPLQDHPMHDLKEVIAYLTSMS